MTLLLFSLQAFGPCMARLVYCEFQSRPIHTMSNESSDKSAPFQNEIEHLSPKLTQHSTALSSRAIGTYTDPKKHTEEWFQDIGIPTSVESWMHIATLHVENSKVGKKRPKVQKGGKLGFLQRKLKTTYRAFKRLPPSMIPLRKLEDWESGSAIGQSHYLASRILWTHASWKQIDTREGHTSWLGLSTLARRRSESYLRNYQAWNAYIADIKV